MEPTVSDPSNALNPEFVQGIVSAVGTAFTQGTANQMESTRMQAEANLKVAAMQQQTQHLSMKFSAAAIGFLLVLAGTVVVASFFVGRFEIVTHTITALGSAAAGWFAGRAKR